MEEKGEGMGRRENKGQEMKKGEDGGEGYKDEVKGKGGESMGEEIGRYTCM